MMVGICNPGPGIKRVYNSHIFSSAVVEVSGFPGWDDGFVDYPLAPWSNPQIPKHHGSLLSAISLAGKMSFHHSWIPAFAGMTVLAACDNKD